MAGLRSGSLGEPVPWVPCSQVTPSPGESWAQISRLLGTGLQGARKPQPGSQGRPPQASGLPGMCPRTCPGHNPQPQPLPLPLFPFLGSTAGAFRTQGPLGLPASDLEAT